MKIDPLNYHRRWTREVKIGNLALGGNQALRIQSMANVSTNDIEQSVAQALRVARCGGDYFRFTAQGVREAKNLGKIAAALREKGCEMPLIADIHFNPLAAYEALEHIEKVRINPGNFADKKGERTLYSSDEEWYEKGRERVEKLFSLFLQKAKEKQRVVRLGVNHGSLSERMLQRWGNTPRGMVESCLEYLRVAEKESFRDIVISMKSSNVQVMTASVRLLAKELELLGWHYPFHLGVTEAGEGEDGRVKSAVGIGSLLLDGLGDTLRVSLSEAPEEELPVAQMLVEHIEDRSQCPQLQTLGTQIYSPFIHPREEANVVEVYGGKLTPKVFVRGKYKGELIPEDGDVILDLSTDWDNFLRAKKSSINWYIIPSLEIDESLVRKLQKDSKGILVLQSASSNAIGEWRRAIAFLSEFKCNAPLILSLSLGNKTKEEAQLVAASDLGTLLLEGHASGVMLDSAELPSEKLYRLALGILQATRLRFSHTEFISCPGCGRTLYNLEGTIAKIKEATSHLPNLKIGIMGCIVNGPGEMSDADYGYVGGAPGKIDLYKGQKCQVRGVSEENAVEALIELIRQNGDWKEPSKIMK